MIKPDQIPDEVEATMEWMILRGEDWKPALAAALSAWLGMAVNDGCPVWHAYPHIILPLPQKENNND